MAPDRSAFVVATDFETGSFGTIGLDAPRAVSPANPSRQIHSDAVPRVAGGRLFVINRFLGDNIQALDPSNSFATLFQCSTGNGTNPNDIAVVSADKAYVTLFERAQLLIVDPTPSVTCSDFIRGQVDLSAFADADGIPEMTQMALHDGRLYVAMQKLDRNNFFEPTGPGVLAVIDVDTDAVVDSIELSGANPIASTKGLTVSNGSLLIGETGHFGVADGGIERVDLATGTAEGFIIDESDLGGDLTDFALDSGERGYAVLSASDFTSSVVAFDLSQRHVTKTLLSGSTFVGDIELNDRGELFVSDRAVTSPGVRIFRGSDGVELTTSPIDLGLPPFELVFLK